MKVLLDGGADHFAFSHMFRLPIDVGGSSRAYEVVDVCLDHYYEKFCLVEDATFGQPSATNNNEGSATALALDHMPNTPSANGSQRGRNLNIDDPVSSRQALSSVKSVEAATKPPNMFAGRKMRINSLFEKESDAGFRSKPAADSQAVDS